MISKCSMKYTKEQLLTVVVAYLISRNISFSFKKSHSTDSYYISISKDKVGIRVSDHFQEDCEYIEIFDVVGLSNIFSLK